MKFFAHHPRIVTTLIVIYASVFFLTSIPLITSDLGRHIMNGKLVWLSVSSQVLGEEVFVRATQDGVGNGTVAEWKAALEFPVLSTNAYSYTHPDFSVINHHWLFGLLAYGVFLAGGFQLLTLMNLVIVGSAIACILVAARYTASWGGVWAAAALLLPLITNRTDARPESFSLLFSALTFLLLVKYTTQRLSLPVAMLSIFIIQLLWVNIHVFFILGLGIIGVFWLESLLGSRKQLLPLTTMGTIGALTAFLNPNGLAGALAPFNIFENYDFLVAENQSTLFMLRILPRPEDWYFAILLIFSVVLGLKALHAQRLKLTPTSKQLQFIKQNLPWLLYVIVLAGVASQINRFYSFFALLALPPLAAVLSSQLPSIKAWIARIFENSFALPFVSLALFSVLGLGIASGLFIPSLFTAKLGISPRMESSATFFSSNPPTGKLFNNYDIGGYLIFFLFPQQRVYTDNRPQEYPPGFFQNYRELQNDTSAWQAYTEANGITAIFFNRHDLTDHGQKFLIERVKDPEWAPVFVDAHTLILYKRTSEHEQIIAQFELPQEMFTVAGPN